MRSIEFEQRFGDSTDLNVHGQTIQFCYEGYGVSKESSICTTNLSTSETLVLTQVEGVGTFPLINDENWIAFLCQEKDGAVWTGLCIIKSDGTDYRVLVEGESIDRLAINNRGQIFYTCEAGLCVTTIDGTFSKQFEQRFRSRGDDFMPTGSSRIDINDNGDLLVFFGSNEIYVGNVNNEKLHRVEGSPIPKFCCAAMNNEGWIVFYCAFESHQETHICSRDPVSGEVKKITVPNATPSRDRYISVSH